MPVMEGKCSLLKSFADVERLPPLHPLQGCRRDRETNSLLAGSFGASTWKISRLPAALRSSGGLKSCGDIPVFHDDQHGTAVRWVRPFTNGHRFVKKDIA